MDFLTGVSYFVIGILGAMCIGLFILFLVVIVRLIQICLEKEQLMVFKVLFAILIGIIVGIGLEYWIFYLTDGVELDWKF